MAHLFQEQITHITVKTNNIVSTCPSFTDTCARILAICTNLSYLNMNQWIDKNCAVLSLHDRPPNICFSSHLRTLFINVETFDDCLCLLDGRLQQLSTFIVRIYSMNTNSSVVHNSVGYFHLVK